MRKFQVLLCLFLFGQIIIAQKATVHFEIRDQQSQALVPAKLVILKDGKPFDHGLSSTEDLVCRGHTVYTRNGKGRIQLPAGAYEFWFGKGMEYSVDVQELIFDRGQTTSIKAELLRELDPKGYVGGDMHLHTYTYSGHGDATVEERLISCAAEGLEWAVATDHNSILDYQPYMKKLGLQNYMATAVGNEVSTNIGHFNTYPLAPESEKMNAKVTVGKELFDGIKAIGMPHTVIQINHPRWVETDFFNTKGLDPYYGRSKHPEWDWGFDAFEVLNENFGIGWRDAPDNNFSVKRDWFNMLNQGIKKTGLGNSDSHSVIAQIAGVPRNYIKSSTDKPSEIDEKELSKSIKNQQVSIACGLFANLTANGNGIGSTVSLNADNPRLELNLEVQAPSWITCHKAELIENGEVIRVFAIPESKAVTRLKETIRIQPKKDSWYMLIAYGDHPMYPMVQSIERPVLPIGFTNPIWIDADGDEKFTSLFQHCAQLIEKQQGKAKELVAALEADAALVYPTFYHLFEKKNEMATKVAQLFLSKANTRQKLLLYRELSKQTDALAKNILWSQKRGKLKPLEEVVLNYYLAFPLHQSKVDKFKKKEKTMLDEQLNHLEDVFRFAYAEATKKSYKIAKADAVNNIASQKWREVEAAPDYMLRIDEEAKKSTGKYHFIHYPLYARMDTSITFYLRSNTNVQIKRGGRILKSVYANERFPIKAKLVKVSLKKGENDLLFRLEDKPHAYISLQDINIDGLVDENLKKVKTVEHLALDKKVKYEITPSPKYHGHNIALTDGYRGTSDYKDQLWQGWNGENAEFIIDLGKEQTIDEVTLGFLINQKAWIFEPKSVRCVLSKDGQYFKNAQSKALNSSLEKSDPMSKDVSFVFDSVKARYVKIIAKKIDAVPDWHSGKGGDAWIFIDEVLVE